MSAESDELATNMPTNGAESERAGELDGAKPDLRELAESENTAVSEDAETLMFAQAAESESAGESADIEPDL